MDEIRRAELLDAYLDEILANRPAVPPDDDTARVVASLTTAWAQPLPRRLEELPPRPAGVLLVRLASAVLGALMALQGISSTFASERLARFLGFEHVQHIYVEQGLAFLAVAALLYAAAIRPRLMTGAVLAGVPLALSLAVFGMFELPGSPNPSAEALHFTQGAVAAVLGALWAATGLRVRRKRRR